MKTIKFSLAFTTKVDEILKNIYSKRVSRERVFTFLEIVETQSYNHPEKQFRYERARLNTDYLRKLLGRNATEIIYTLLNNNIISTNNHFIVGEKSKDYWISDSFMDIINNVELDIQTDIYIDNEFLNNNISTIYNPKFNNILKTLNKLTFDYHGAMNWLLSLDKNVHFTKIDGTLNINKFNCYYRMIQNVNDKKWIVVEDEKTGRIFTTFNLIKRELREFCYLEGEKLVSSDLKSSQPYFLASYLLNKYNDNKNVQLFFNTITTSDIYTYFLDRYVELNGSNSYEDYNTTKFINETKYITCRNDVKPQFCKVLFKNNKGPAALLNVFKTDFNDVYNYIKELKNVKSNELALTLQSNESEIFIGTSNKLFNNDILNLTAHDSIYVKKSDKNIMLEFLNSEFVCNGYQKYELK